MVRRITTNGMMQSYKSNLMRSYNNLANITQKVTTQRQFNSYAESPAKASQAFQLRRSRWNTENQLTNSLHVKHKFQQAWNCLESTYQDLGHSLAKYSALRANNGATAGGRQGLGEVIQGAAESVMETMNAKYGENFIFSGADGANVPFSWSTDGEVLYRGMKVDVVTPTADELKTGDWQKDTTGKYDDFAKLYDTVVKEHTYVDLGMGMKENNDGELIDSSAFDTALSGIKMIGYGLSDVTLEDGTVVKDVPNNLISIMKEMGEIFSGCTADSGAYTDCNGKYASAAEAEQRAEALEIQLQAKLDELHSNYVELDTQASFVNDNASRLESMDDTLNEQITTIEDIDPADAITALMWAQYSYNAALRIGTNILSQSLLDYMS